MSREGYELLIDHSLVVHFIHYTAFYIQKRQVAITLLTPKHHHDPTPIDQPHASPHRPPPPVVHWH